MKIGITGTREGANKSQLERVAKLLTDLKGTELHHGDCVGVDEQVAGIARYLGYKIICHPPKSSYLRANYPSDDYKKPLDYLSRDRAIVDATDLLIVVPLHNEWQPRGGTWYTHDYAQKKRKPMELIWPKDVK